MSRTGFTLIEVLLALLIVSSGIGAVLGALAQSTRLAARGRERGRIATALQSRADWLRLEARRQGCIPPEGGTARHSDGVREAWSTRAAGSAIEGLLLAWPGGRSGPIDTLLIRFPCG